MICLQGDEQQGYGDSEGYGHGEVYGEGQGYGDGSELRIPQYGDAAGDEDDERWEDERGEQPVHLDECPDREA